MEQEPSKQLPCDSNGVCLACKETYREFETLLCKTCKKLWHMLCLLLLPSTFYDWECPGCSQPIDINNVASPPLFSDEEMAEMYEELLVGSSTENNIGSNVVFDISSIKCSYCMELPERPVTVSFFLFPPFYLLKNKTNNFSDDFW